MIILDLLVEIGYIFRRRSNVCAWRGTEKYCTTGKRTKTKGIPNSRVETDT